MFNSFTPYEEDYLKFKNHIKKNYNDFTEAQLSFTLLDISPTSCIDLYNKAKKKFGRKDIFKVYTKIYERNKKRWNL